MRRRHTRRTRQWHAIQTRNVYQFERYTHAISKYAQRQRPLRTLRRLAERIWNTYGRNGMYCPTIRIGEGVVGSIEPGARVPYAEGYSLVELTQNDRSIATLVHELAHCMGYGNPHGIGFIRRYIDLLERYGQCNRFALEQDAAFFKVAGALRRKQLRGNA